MRAIIAAVPLLAGLALGAEPTTTPLQACVEQCQPFLWRGCGHVVREDRSDRRNRRAFAHCVQVTLESCQAGFPLLKLCE